MKKVKVYLGGAMSCLSKKDRTEWRESAKHKLEIQYGNDVKIIDPTKLFDIDSIVTENEERYAQQLDLHFVSKSDVFLVNLASVDKSIGTAMEIMKAHDNNVTIIGFGDAYNIHAWIKNYLDFYSPTLDYAIEIIGTSFF